MARVWHAAGTLLVDVETRRPVDILDERSSDSFAAWLAARPGAQLICRDQAGVYSDGGTRGAPGALPVADRWDLWHNLGEAVERAVSRHRDQLPAAGQALASRVPGTPPDPARVPAALRAGPIADRPRARHADGLASAMSVGEFPARQRLGREQHGDVVRRRDELLLSARVPEQQVHEAIAEGDRHPGAPVALTRPSPVMEHHFRDRHSHEAVPAARMADIPDSNIGVICVSRTPRRDLAEPDSLVAAWRIP